MTPRAFSGDDSVLLPHHMSSILPQGSPRPPTLKAGENRREPATTATKTNGLPKPLPRTAKLLVTTEPPVGIEPTTYSLRASRPHVRRSPPTYGNRWSAANCERCRTSADDQELRPELRPLWSPTTNRLGHASDGCWRIRNHTGRSGRAGVPTRTCQLPPGESNEVKYVHREMAAGAPVQPPLRYNVGGGKYGMFCKVSRIRETAESDRGVARRFCSRRLTATSCSHLVRRS